MNDLRLIISFCFSPHPYLFFNSDKFTFTFLGFNIDRRTGNLVDQQTKTVLENSIMKTQLYDALIRNHAPLKENFDSLPRLVLHIMLTYIKNKTLFFN